MSRTQGLPLQARRMLLLLHERGGWVRSSDLAQALGFTRLKRSQMHLLQNMAEMDLIEVRPPFTGIRRRTPYEYSAPGTKLSDALTPHARQLLEALNAS